MGHVIFSDDDVFLVEGSRYVGLVLFKEGLNLFSPFGGIVFPTAGDTTGGGRFGLPAATSDC